jgi:site-specific DNA-cytosine methylase
VIDGFNAHKERHDAAGDGFGWKPTDGDCIAASVTNQNGSRNTDNFIKEPKIDVLGELQPGQNGTIYGTEGVSPTICAGEGVKCNTKIAEPTFTCGCEGALRRIENPRIEEKTESITFKGKQIHEGDGLYLGTSERYMRGGLKDCSRALKAGINDAGVAHNHRIRKLTERECFRLMGVCEEYIDLIQAAGISRSQQYKMAGNSIVVDVLVAIFRQLLIGNKNAFQQLEIF